MTTILRAAYETHRHDCETRYPHEACGLLAGPAAPDRHSIHILEAHPVENLNTERAPDRFILNPREHDQIDQALRARGLEVVGIYHSHPDHPSRPSQFDLDRAMEVVAAFGDNPWVYTIAAIAKGRLETCRAWVLNSTNDAFEESELQIHEP